MYLFIGDETNNTQSKRSRFFIYGALLVDMDVVDDLDQRINNIRAAAGLRTTDPLKFDTRSRPDDVTFEDYTAAKDAVIDACLEADVQFIAYAILHDIARGSADDMVRYALNSTMSVFNHQFLVDQGDQGICVVDRFEGDHKVLREKHQRGIFMQESDKWVSLSRIKLFATTCDGASNLSSACDIVLGAFRYCVNEEEKTDVPKALLPRIARMMYHKRQGNTLYLRDHGLILRPQTIKVAAYRDEYDLLVERFKRILDEAESDG